MNDSENLRYEFDQYCLDAAKRLLLRAGEPVPLQAKAFDTLLVLIENRDRVVGKDELMKKVWPDTFVEEINLTVNISALRKALGESPNEHRYIVTVPRRGYRFVAEVRELKNGAAAEVEAAPNGQPAAPEPEQPQAARFFKARYVAPAIALVALALAGLMLFTRQAKHEARIETIAVLPFRELGAGAEDHLGSGMADALVTRLSQIKQLIIRPTSAVLKYRDAQTDPLAAGRELGADALLDGKIQRTGARIRVTVQLLKVKDGRPLWADTFDEDFTNILSVQDVIAARVAKELALKLTSAEQAALVRRHTSNHQAWQAYTKGRHFLSLRTEHGLRKAIESFEQASAADPGYAPAYVGLADSYSLLGYYSFVTPEAAYEPARAAAGRALSLDATLADAHTSLGLIRMNYEWDFAAAEQSYLKALELDPQHGVAHARYATCLLALGRFAEALAEIGKARRTDPLFPVFIVLEGDILRYARRYDEALEKYREALHLNPNHSAAHAQMAEAYEAQGRFANAVKSYAQALALSGDGPEIISTLAEAYRRAGMQGYWRKSIELMSKAVPEKPALAFPLATLCLKAGEKERALAWLEQVRRQRQPGLIYLNVDPLYDSLRVEPRFVALLQRAGLAAASSAPNSLNPLRKRTG